MNTTIFPIAQDIEVNLVSTQYNEINIPAKRTVIITHIIGGQVFLFDESRGFELRGIFLEAGETITIYTHYNQVVKIFTTLAGTFIRVRIC